MLCGPMAPPIGGVSIHISRLMHGLDGGEYEFLLCDESREIKEDVFNLRSLDVLGYLKMCRQADIVHVHSGTSLLRLFHLIVATLFRKKKVLSIHAWPSRSLPAQLMASFFSALSHKLIVVSEEIRRQFRHGETIPAFIPPDVENEVSLPQAITDWCAWQRKQERKLVCSNAFRLDWHDGADLYGLDLCLDAMSSEALRKNYSLIFVVSDPSYAKARLNQYMRRVRERNLEDRVLIYCGHVSFFKLLELCDISVRATNTDGDSLSVRESLFLNKKTLASDAVTRPPGVVLFKSRDSRSLAASLELADDTTRPLSMDATQLPSVAEAIAEIYVAVALRTSGLLMERKS